MEFLLNLGLPLQILLGFVALFLVGSFFHYYQATIGADRQARAHGCGTTLKGPVWPFGLLNALRAAYYFINHDVLEYMRRDFYEKYGHTVSGSMAGLSGIVTNDPENIKTVLATSFKDFSLGERYPMFFPLLGNGIFTLSGDGWKHSRTMLRPQFSRDQVSHVNSIKEHVNVLISKLDEGRESGKLVDVQDLFHALTIDTATEFLFGESTGTLHDSSSRVQGPTRSVSGPEFSKAFGAAQETLAFRFMAAAMYWLVDSPQFRRNADICKNFIDYFVLKALEKPLEKDEVADKYVFIRELTKETRDPVVIRDQAFNILLAGRDTTASTMSFMAAHLSKHPDVWRKLRADVLKTFGTDTDGITFESLKRCKYLNNVLNEILRLHPIVAINFRQAIRDTKLPHGGGPNGDQPVFVPKGNMIMYSPYAMHRDPDYWGADADKFIPERWDTVGGHTWSFLPFNGGPRICLGQQFALTEMGITWVRLAQTFERFETELAFTNLERPPAHQRVTISVSGGVPSRWYRA